MRKTMILVLSLGLSVNAAFGFWDELRLIDGDDDGQIDDSLIQQITFDVTAGTTLSIASFAWESTVSPPDLGYDLNSDGEVTAFDSYMHLYSGFTLLAENNDDAFHPHPYAFITNLNSHISYTFNEAGTYMVTIGQYDYSTEEAFAGYQIDRGFSYGFGVDHADYELIFNASSGAVSNITVLEEPIPMPPTVAIHTAVEIEWNSTSGTTYQVQYSTNLASTNWFNLSNSVMATNTTSYMLDSTRNVSNRFYRVIKE